MVGELLQVSLLLGELLLELHELLLLAHADGVVLVGLLALLESVTVVGSTQSQVSHGSCFSESERCHEGLWW